MCTRWLVESSFVSKQSVVCIDSWIDGEEEEEEEEDQKEDCSIFVLAKFCGGGSGSGGYADCCAVIDDGPAPAAATMSELVEDKDEYELLDLVLDERSFRSFKCPP